MPSLRIRHTNKVPIEDEQMEEDGVMAYGNSRASPRINPFGGELENASLKGICNVVACTFYGMDLL